MHSLAELRAEAQALGLSVQQSGKRPAKSDYIDALRVHYGNKQFYDDLAPMLCFNYWDLSKKEQTSIWKDRNDWVAQVKLNGIRLILHFIAGVGTFAHSRVVSVTNYKRCELTEDLPFRGFIPSFTATVDCEQTPDKIYVFDITNWEGVDLKKKRLCERLAYLLDFQKLVGQVGLDKHLEFPLIHLHGKWDFFERIIASGGEGIVLKYLNAPYNDNTSRSRWGWVKCKRRLEFDAYVSGFMRGRPISDYATKVASLVFSVVTDKGYLQIARISNLPWFYRKQISFYDRTTGEVRLNPDTYGRVAHISGLEISRRARRLVHAKIEYWRKDLSQDQCRYAFDDIEAIRKGAIILPMRVVGAK